MMVPTYGQDLGNDAELADQTLERVVDRLVPLYRLAAVPSSSGGRANNLAVLGDGARILADSSSGIVVSHSQRLISLI
ncbi:hypothetical protein IAE22_29235, partial [Bacillus sp. S34]|nr:hypothetical protein [Bacillus sp. S34]